MSGKAYPLLLAFLGALLLLGAAVEPALAEVIDRIQIYQAGEEAEIRIQFVTRVQYIRQVMLKNGDIRIYFNLLEIDAADPRLVWQKRESPPSNIAPHFTVTYPETDSSLSISFGKAVDYHVRPGNDGRSIRVFTPIIKPASQPLTPATIPPATVISAPPSDGFSAAPGPTLPGSAAGDELTELQAKQLMDNSILALKNKSYPEAIVALRKLLTLPPNQQTQTAQLMIGQVYEKNGELTKARAEYYLYITRYPKAKNLDQARANLARMIMATYEAGKSAPEKLAADDKLSIFGGFSQYYSKGLLHTDSRATPSAVVTSSNSSDQSQLLSSMELNGQKRSHTTETRLVFRDTFTASFIDSIGSNNFLQAAYFEQEPNDQSHLYGLGRRTGSAGSLPSRFDGAWVARSLGDAWRASASIGSPVAASGSKEEVKSFGAVSVDFNSPGRNWSGSTYFIGQRVANIMDKRAAGMEAHYFDARGNHMTLFEYDTLFKKLNIGLIQGNWITASGANYTLL